jgi:nicotinate phosphoribosyltransferase
MVEGGKFKELEYDIKDVSDSRKYYLKSLDTLSDERKRLKFPHLYKVDLSQNLYDLKFNLIAGISRQIEEE